MSVQEYLVHTLVALNEENVSTQTRLEENRQAPRFEEGELFTLAGFLSSIPTQDTKEKSSEIVPRLDPYVAGVLAEEPLALWHWVSRHPEKFYQECGKRKSPQ